MATVSTLILPETGFLRIKQVLQFIPVSKSGWWAGVAEGRYPKPVKLSPRTSAQKAEDIRALIEELGKQDLGGEAA